MTTLLCAVDVASHLGRYALSALSGVLSETLELNLLYSVGRQETLRQHDLDIWRVPECVEQCSVFIGVTMRGVPPAPPIGRGHGFGVEEHPMRTMFRRARKTFGRSVEFEYEYVEEEEEDERAICE